MTPFYVTTPIYYVNDKPHIGHAYTTVLADVLARFHRLAGDPTYFLTGTDEHGQKVEKAAKQNNMTPIEQCDQTVVRFKELWTKLGISHNDFIRTTEKRHTRIVQQVLQSLFDQGLIYKAEYTGHYCVPCERFFTEKDLLDGNLCPECKRKVEPIVESNYFFKMSQYQQWLIDYIQDNPGFILPPFRANETLGFLKKPLNDLCISRPKSRLSWGIELPFDTDYVCYVWFDALLNYVSALGYGSDNHELFDNFWTEATHLIGKDILTTHTVYWPTMLKAMNLPMPKHIFAHGWWLMGEDKMSKSLGNVVNPMDLCERYGVDAFRYYVMAEMTPGQDASFTPGSFITRYNSDLANDLGNLLSRVTKMIAKQCQNIVPEPTDLNYVDDIFKNEVMTAVPAAIEAIGQMRVNGGIEKIMAAVRAGNRYLEQTAPWSLAKNGQTARLNSVLYTAAEALRILSSALAPVMPEKMMTVLKALGYNCTEITPDDLKTWGLLKPGSVLNEQPILFPRIDEEAEAAAAAKAAPAPVETKVAESELNLVTIDDFFKTQLRSAKVIAAERVEKADKLLKLMVQIGDEKRQIVAGVAQYYSPETILGKTIVIVYNLKPAKIRGIDSFGMLLAAKKGTELRLVTLDGEMESGAQIG